MLTDATLAVDGAGSTGATPALHEIFVPPFVPAHVQLQDPAPLTADAVPAEHKFVVGALVN